MIHKLIESMKIGTKDALDCFGDIGAKHLSRYELTVVVETLLFRMNDEYNNNDLLKKVAIDLDNNFRN